MIFWRRVHNQTYIKHRTKISDNAQEIKDGSQIINNNQVSKKRFFLESLFVLVVVILPISVQAGIFFKASPSFQEEYFNVTESSSPLDVVMLTALQNPNSLNGLGGAEILVNEGTLVSPGPVGQDVIANTKISSGEISVYVVREGDTLSHIAEMYGVTSNTILWANDLPRATSIRVGQSLIILPVAGVRHVVKKGDTVQALAKTYDGDVDEILTYNQILPDESLLVGSTIVIPGGAMHTAPLVKTSSPTRTSGSVSRSGWLSHPAPGSVKTQGLHGYNAVDLAAPAGTPVRAAASGQVIVSKAYGWNGGYGQYIVIKHSNGAQTLYGHLSSNGVGVGASVNQGEVIGRIGNTGRSTGSHLHFEVRGASNPF